MTSARIRPPHDTSPDEKPGVRPGACIWEAIFKHCHHPHHINDSRIRRPLRGKGLKLQVPLARLPGLKFFCRFQVDLPVTLPRHIKLLTLFPLKKLPSRSPSPSQSPPPKTVSTVTVIPTYSYSSARDRATTVQFLSSSKPSSSRATTKSPPPPPPPAARLL